MTEDGAKIFFRGPNHIRKKAAESQGGKYFGLDPNEEAIVWFLTPHEELLSFDEHRVEMPGGKAKLFVCTVDSGSCRCCDLGVKKSFKAAAVIWNDTAKTVQVAKLGIRFWQTQEEFAATYGSLTDRPYKIKRTGVALDTVWHSTPLDKAQCPDLPEGTEIPDVGDYFKFPSEAALEEALGGDSQENTGEDISPYGG